MQVTLQWWEQLPASAAEREVLHKELLSACESIEWQVRQKNHHTTWIGSSVLELAEYATMPIGASLSFFDYYYHLAQLVLSGIMFLVTYRLIRIMKVIGHNDELFVICHCNCSVLSCGHIIGPRAHKVELGYEFCTSPAL